MFDRIRTIDISLSVRRKITLKGGHNFYSCNRDSSLGPLNWRASGRSASAVTSHFVFKFIFQRMIEIKQYLYSFMLRNQECECSN
jgi:hypothetical protein